MWTVVRSCVREVDPMAETAQFVAAGSDQNSFHDA
jgi:hypothetical protein